MLAILLLLALTCVNGVGASNNQCEKKQWNLFCLETFSEDLFDCIDNFNAEINCFNGFCADFTECLTVATIKTTTAFRYLKFNDDIYYCILLMCLNTRHF